VTPAGFPAHRIGIRDAARKDAANHVVLAMSVLATRGRGRAAGCALAVAGCLLLAGSLLAGCGLVGAPTTFQGEFTVTSPVVSKGIIPLRYTCHGEGLSPPLHWSGAPAGTKTLALVVDDAAAPITPYINWIVFDINPTTTDIQAGQLPTGARQADNSAGHAVYNPPCPRNGDHSYRFTVYALHSAVSLPNGTDLKSAWLAISRATIAHGRLPVIAKS
jgi:Raf kinase inhibitor-like YbhB/YbcL family protein